MGKEFVCSAGDPGSIAGSERFAGEGNGNPLQYSCLRNPMDRGARQSVGSGTTEPARRHLVSGLTEGQFLVFSFFLKLSFFCLGAGRIQ